MTQKALHEILAKHGGAAARGNRLEVADAVSLTLFAAFADEALIVDRVRAIELESEYVVAHTTRNERFVVAYEDVRAVRFAGNQGGAGYAT